MKRSLILFISAVMCLILISFQNCGQRLSSQLKNSPAMSLSASPVNSNVYTVGEIYGACTVQLNDQFQVVNNGEFDSNDNRLSNLPNEFKEIISGGATWPVTYCPNKGSNLDVRCAEGFKPTLRESSQMNAGSGFIYWATYNCIKL